jgi:hypothetical protein
VDGTSILVEPAILKWTFPVQDRTFWGTTAYGSFFTTYSFFQVISVLMKAICPTLYWFDYSTHITRDFKMSTNYSWHRQLLRSRGTDNSKVNVGSSFYLKLYSDRACHTTTPVPPHSAKYNHMRHHLVDSIHPTAISQQHYYIKGFYFFSSRTNSTRAYFHYFL